MPSPRWQTGMSGNPGGRPRGSRNTLSEEVICALLRDFRQHGQKAIARVRETQPGVYLKVMALLVPKEHKVEMANAITGLTDTQLELMIEDLQRRIEGRVSGAKLIEAEAMDRYEPHRQHASAHTERSNGGSSVTPSKSP